MADTATVSVRGEARIEAEPETAQVTVSVSARAKDRAQVLALLAKRRDDVASLLEGHGAAVEKVEGGSTDVHPELKDDRGKERIAGYLGSSRFVVTVGDFTLLGEIVTSLARQEMTSITGPFWQLREDSPVYRQARVVAAQDALTRAREYAEAFGTSVLELLELADLGLLGDSTADGARGLRRTMASRASMSDDEPVFNFTPVAQVVYANVDARFTVAAPDLST